MYNPKGEILHFGPWQIPYKAVNVLSPDGIRRVAKVSNPDTFFTIPASMKVRGKTVSGYIDSNEDDGLRFHQYQGGINNHIFWKTPEDARQWIIDNIVPNDYFEYYHIASPKWFVRYFHTRYTKAFTITITWL